MSERLVPHSDALLTEMGDGTGVLLHLGTKFYYTLNTTGVVMWKLIDTRKGEATVPNLVAELTERCAVDEATARRDVERLVADLLSEGLLAKTG